MEPVFFKFQLPEFFHKIFPEYLHIPTGFILHRVCILWLLIILYFSNIYIVPVTGAILLFLLISSLNKKSPGQIFLLYLLSYFIRRFFTGIFRGDSSRGYLCTNYFFSRSLGKLYSFFVALSTVENFRGGNIVYQFRRKR